MVFVFMPFHRLLAILPVLLFFSAHVRAENPSPVAAHGFREPVERSQCRVLAQRADRRVSEPGAPASIVAEGKTITLVEARGSRTFEMVAGPILDPVLNVRPRRIFWITAEEICVLNPASGQAKTALRERGLSGGGQLFLADGRVFLKRLGDDACLVFQVTAKGATGKKVACPGN
jgi:hypothetical protein